MMALYVQNISFFEEAIMGILVGHDLNVDERALMARVLEHYRLVGPLIEASFAQTPIVFVNYPGDVDKGAVFHVTTVPLTSEKLLWLIHREYAIEFYTWAPTLLDVERLRYARILLEAPAGVEFERVKLAALAMRALLFDAAKLEAVPLLDGGTGIALWIPLADAPRSDVLRKCLHALCARAVELHPDLVSAAYNTHHDGRVHLHVSSNAAGHYSAVPYSLRAQTMAVCTPIHWEELGAVSGADAFGIVAIPGRLASKGDVFASEVKVIAEQRFNAVQL
jgi:DNA primase